MDGKDADVYARPYRESPAASAAVAATMDKMDWGKLLKEVDDGYRSWRKPSLLLYGSNDPFVKVPEAFDFLESKRTNMKCVTPSAKLGHMPQEDYAEAIADAMAVFLSGTADDWAPAEMLKMTKRGAVRA